MTYDVFFEERFSDIPCVYRPGTLTSVVIDNEGNAQRPTGFNPAVVDSFSSDARAYVLRNPMSKSTAELMAHARAILKVCSN